MNSALKLVVDGINLNHLQAEEMMMNIIEEKLNPIQIASFLTALKLKNETVEEISGFVNALQKKAIHVNCARSDMIDVCGTGGDNSGTFNISTAVAILLASTGVAIAKHGNRSVSSRSGSFDVLEKLGIYSETDPLKAAKSLDEFGVTFLFAPAFHPALKSVSTIRKDLGMRTVFNLLGPLLNPAKVKRQLIGVYSPEIQMKMASVLKTRGVEEAMIVHGSDGLDEITISGKTHVVHLKNGDISQYNLDPSDFGFSPVDLAEVKGGGPEENAEIISEIFHGLRGPKRNIVVMNASAALVIAGKAKNFLEGVKICEETLDSGKTLQLLQTLRSK